MSWNILFSSFVQSNDSQPPCEAVSWNISSVVDTLVSLPSASLWGCELKCISLCSQIFNKSQPPCEAVSWNVPVCSSYHFLPSVSLLVRLWVEITHIYNGLIDRHVSLLVRLWVEICWYSRTELVFRSQPPCEAVSWNIQNKLLFIFLYCQPPCEAVSWNDEVIGKLKRQIGQPPCEAVSWNVFCYKSMPQIKTVSLLVRLWVEMLYAYVSCIFSWSASLWGCELK